MVWVTSAAIAGLGGILLASIPPSRLPTGMLLIAAACWAWISIGLADIMDKVARG